MNRSSAILLCTVLLALLGGPQQASAQQLFPAQARPVAASPKPPAAPSPRAASCHNGASFDRFLADLEQQAAAAGVSQRALSEAAPYLVYDQGIVNRDRGQRVFGQIFTEFAGRMAAPYRMQQGQARIKT
jgi:membrane-bound lytic murein transglycosylase B